MALHKKKSVTNTAASRLRTIIASHEDGYFLGGEKELQQLVGASRATLRQVARLLEREGLLRVRAGGKGGYFACKPSFGSMEVALTAHLERLDVRIEELLAIASITWTESVEQAATLNNDTSRGLAEEIAETVRAVPPDITNRALIEIEQHIRSRVFELIDCPYMRLIFEVNVRFARHRFEGPGQIRDESDDQARFVEAWRSAKLLELEAIARGDAELGSLAAKRTREVWSGMMRATSSLSGVPHQD
jgi:GntR family transcriptional regulator, transcriptional repressor for pyruvate dehydrogenase complex